MKNTKPSVLCVVAFAAGEKYIQYLPLFVYSLKRAYPEYGVRVFGVEDMDAKTKKALRLINHGDFEYIKLKLNNTNLSLKFKKLIRWVLLLEDYIDIRKYEYVYYSDVDIFFLKDELGLVLPHVKHMEFISLPFSNTCRCRTITFEDYFGKLNLKKYVKKILQGRLVDVAELIAKRKISYFRLTGLHFVDAHVYLSRTREVRVEYFNYMEKGLVNKFPLGADDEVFLYELCEKSGFSLTELSKRTFDCVELGDPLNPLRWNYRPTHGIHLGDFRESLSTAIKTLQPILHLGWFVNYLDQFDEVYKDLKKSDFYFLLDDDLRRQIEDIIRISFVLNGGRNHK